MRVLLLTLAGVAACDGSGPPETSADILRRINQIAGVTATQAHPPDAEPGLAYFELEVTQPLDHDHPARGSYAEYVELIQADPDAPTILYTSGYGASFASHRGELAEALDANQLRVAYRFFDQDVAAPDWSLLTVEQGAADLHAIVQDLRPIEIGAWLHAGGSKGGMTALFSRYLYPDDVDGVVAYVAPIMTANPDERYAHVLDNLGDATCRSNLRAAARAIAGRRAAMETLAMGEGNTYDVAGLDYAAEVAITELEWSFWQYRGADACDAIPAPGATDTALYSFLSATSPISAYDDESMLDTEQPFVWQAMSQLGYPRLDTSNVADLIPIDYQDLSPQLPAGVAPPTLDPSLSEAVIAWARAEASRVILVYGEWDPWSAGGALDVSAANDSFVYVEPGASHVSATLGNLAGGARDQVSDALARWTGVAPDWATARGTMRSPIRSRSSASLLPP